MNTHKILLGALLIKPDLAPYSLPELEIEYFPADLQPAGKYSISSSGRE